MTVRALTEYYDRKMLRGEMPPLGFEHQPIPFLIVLNESGEFAGFKDTRADAKDRGGKYTVRVAIKPSCRGGSAINPNLLYDNLEYIFGVGGTSAAVSKKRRESFLRKIQTQIPESVAEDSGVRAVVAFLQNPDMDAVRGDPMWAEICDERLRLAYLSFQLANSDYAIVSDSPPVAAEIKRNVGAAAKPDGRCIISGDEDEIPDMHNAVRGVNGAGAGAGVIAFKQSAFNSYGKTKAKNASVGKATMYKYTAALNMLLTGEQKIKVGDSTAVFWAGKDALLETDFSVLFGGASEDNPDRRTAAVKKLYESPRSGKTYAAEGDLPFYVLGLWANRVRLTVRFWHDGTVGDVAERIRRHFDDIKIDGADDSRPPGLFRLLVATAVQGKADNIPPNLGGEMMQAILQNSPYPRTAFLAAVNRCRAGVKYGERRENVSPDRAALLRGCINRFYRAEQLPPALQLNKEIDMKLDPEVKSPGYWLGALFAALEKLQEDANPGINATIRDRYYGAASSSPGAAFPALIKLHQHHLSKLKDAKPGLAVNRQKTVGEIMCKLANFPPQLTMQEQGLFALGYYHQRQNFFTKKENNNE